MHTKRRDSRRRITVEAGSVAVVLAAVVPRRSQVLPSLDSRRGMERPVRRIRSVRVPVLQAVPLAVQPLAVPGAQQQVDLVVQAAVRR
jgi:hypothetical protein